MTKKFLLKIGKGTFETGFPVSLIITGETSGILREFIGKLPPSPQLSQIYERWKVAYNYSSLYSRALKKPQIAITHIRGQEEIRLLGENLRDNFNYWLKSQEFRCIREGILAHFSHTEEILAIIQTDEIVLRRLPWHTWDIFEDFSNIEVALSPLVYHGVECSKFFTPRDKVRICAILGDGLGIDIHQDRELLGHLPNAEVNILFQPSRKELDSFLWDEQGWDILFFAGHSNSEVDGKTGSICINETDSLTVSELKNALKAAIQRGLKIAIFNSCDGLGLAQSLSDLHIPIAIVMREPVPDIVAHEFLKYFLFSFSSGKSLYTSFREARERLQGLEDYFPFASWLPVLFQNPTYLAPTWEDFCLGSFAIQQEAKKQYLILSLKLIEVWNKWREKNCELFPDLSNVDLVGVNLVGANLSGVNFSGANLTEANLTSANLSCANLTSANLTAVQALNTNFERAILTGACLEDWNINNKTNLKDITCHYVYLRGSKQERRPSSGEFAPGEFTKLFQKALETVDLIFTNGIDWKAFMFSFQELQTEYREENLSVQAIEKKTDGAFLIRLELPPEANKAEIERYAKELYEIKLNALEARYRAELQAKNEQIASYREHNASLENVIKILGTIPIQNVIDVKAKTESQSKFYVEYPAIEQRCYQEIRKPGSLIRIKSPRQIGKSSLLARILQQAENLEDVTVTLDFQLAEEEFFTNSNTFLRWFCDSISQELAKDNQELQQKLLHKLDEHWYLSQRIGSMKTCKDYFEQYLLTEIKESLTLGLETVDRLFEYPKIYKDFFRLLRSWHEEGKWRDIWKKLRIVIVHSTEVDLPMDINQWLFNVGLEVELSETYVIPANGEMEKS